MKQCIARIALTTSLAPGLSTCATPATDVHVQTMSMRQALDASQAFNGKALAPADLVPGLSSAALPPGAQRPLLSTPDIRLAYLYEWVDGDGNRHFGEWVAIPVAGFHWIMNDGSRSPAPLAPASADASLRGQDTHP